jgi:serine/threonine protein kinase
VSKPDLADEKKFELLAEIALGQTARIELCRLSEGPSKDSLVAVKRLLPHVAADDAFVDMFRDEVWMTSALQHTHVVQVLAWGHDRYGPYLAAELVAGVSLLRLMKTVFDTGERFSERMVVFLARCMCDGLAEAHSLVSASGEPLELVHRDLSPGNILLGFRGEVKVADFGLAKARKRLTKTVTGLLKGQPGYMSPEQVAGTRVDARSDLFSLGVVMFELFCGRSPFSAPSAIEAMRLVTAVDYPSLLSLRPNIDKALVELVDRCLQKSPADRFQSAGALRDRLDHWLDVHGYREKNKYVLARFVRRNSMRQKRWFERAVAGNFREQALAERAVIWPELQKGSASPARKSSAKEQAAGPRKERIDWGDDGPTLVQHAKVDAASKASPSSADDDDAEDLKATRLRKPKRGRRPLAGIGGAGSKGRGHGAAQKALPAGARRPKAAPAKGEADGVAKSDEAEEETKRKQRAKRGDAFSRDATRAKRAEPARPQGTAQGPLGVLAPHDPDVPPVPSARLPLATETLVRSEGEGRQSVLPFAAGVEPAGVEPAGVEPAGVEPAGTGSLPVLPVAGAMQVAEPGPAANAPAAPVASKPLAAKPVATMGTEQEAAEDTGFWQRAEEDTAAAPAHGEPWPAGSEPLQAPGPSRGGGPNDPGSGRAIEAAEVALEAARQALKGNRMEAISRVSEAERLLQRTRRTFGGTPELPPWRDDPAAWLEQLVMVLWWRSRSQWILLRSGDPFAVMLVVILVVLLLASLW